MRRQARKSVSGALIVRSASALQVWLWLLLFVFQNEFRISWSIKPGYLDYDNLPETNFTCTGKVIGGYYADLETSCQMFHVCTIGQQNEPMDIKFLCLNGTVFDQETRVCERVDEVDCTKSEKFYSLNLELYGSTVPPIVPPEPEKPQAPETEPAQKTNHSNTHILTDYVNENPTTPDKSQSQQSDTSDSTEDPIQDYKKEEPKPTSNQHLLPSKDEDELNEEYEEEDDEAVDNENTGFDEDYSQPFTTTTVQIITSTTTTTKKPTTSSTTINPPSSNFPYLPPLITTPSPLPPSFAPSISPSSTIDPSLLSPQEFIYRHRGPGSEAISFQRQSFRPADGVYITHAPSQQFDHFQYESSRTAPRPVVSHPAPFQRPSPSPFRATTIDPSDQILRPVANTQSSERHETTIKHRPQNYPAHLPAQPPLPFNPFYYDRKRSDDILPDDKSSLSARSVAPPPTETERPPIKLKSPPRVIVTASASVSDSNGKRLNYTVGNVVSAVKPIVPINYDDYKESDLIFDPFFLDVPKLHPKRKTRSSNSRKIISVPALTAKPLSFKSDKIVTTLPPQTSQATTAKASSFTQSPTTTVGWNPHDYVDDNYEPHSYMQPVPPLAVLLNRDYTQPRKPDKPVKNVASEKELKSSHILKQSKSTSLEAQKISSQNVGTEAAVPVTSPTPYGAPTCVPPHSPDCRTRA